MSRLGHALIAPLLLALSLGALASGVDTYQFRHPELQTRAQEVARALRLLARRPLLANHPAPATAPSPRLEQESL